MGSRIVLCGEIHLSKEAFERAQDEVSFHPKGVAAKKLFSAGEKKHRKWARNSYEPDTSRWIMSASIHDKALAGLRALLARQM